MDAAVATGQQFTSGSDGVNQSHEQIDRITYLASLASSHEGIDEMMDTLRRITARWDQSKALSAGDVSSLKTLEHQLKEYLLHKDPLRTFTAEFLDARLREQGSMGARLKARKRELSAVVLLSAVAATIGYFAPISALTSSNRILLAGSFFLVVLHFGIAWFFLSALRNFRPEVRRAFIYFAIGVIILGIGFAHYVVIELFHLYKYEAFRYSGITALFALPFMLMYLGLRTSSTLLGIQTRFNSLAWVFGAVGVVGVISIFIPHKQVGSELFFDIAVFCALAITILGLAASRLAAKIREQTIALYKKPMTILSMYLAVVSFGGIGGSVTLFILGELHGAGLAFVISVFGIPQQLQLLFTGYLFKKETDR